MHVDIRASKHDIPLLLRLKKALGVRKGSKAEGSLFKSRHVCAYLFVDQYVLCV